MNVRQGSFALAAPLVAAAVMLGCAGGFNNFEEPVVSLRQVTVRGVGLTGGNMDLVVDVFNPNGFDLRGTRLQLGFDVEGSHVGDITYEDEFQVQRGDTTSVVLPLRFNWNGVSSAVRAALGYGDIPYTMKGQATVKTPFGDRVIPFTRQGRAPLTRSSGSPPPNPGR